MDLQKKFNMVCFIILHYKNKKDTLECIESIRKLKGEYKIIVVDNNTTNQEEEMFFKKHCDDFIRLNKNMGFAKANNIGCECAKEKYHPDFLIVTNNDILIEDTDIINKIKKEYQQTKFDILGPRIKTNGGESVNPFPVYKTQEEVLKEIKKTKQLISIYQSKTLRFLLKIYLNLKKRIRKEHSISNGQTKECGVALHGCFLIFSRRYYQKYQDVFYNETFLYHEEEFLYQRVVKDHLVSIYTPDIEVFHKEGASLNNVYQEEYPKLIFKNKERLKSLELLYAIMTK